MRILLITQWFEPEPVAKGLSFAKALQDRGHTVQVLTGFPNYPTGKVYQGYKIKFFQKEQQDGIDIIRVPLYPSHNSSAFGRIINYMSFAMAAAMLGPWLTRKVDMIYVYHPPPTSYIPAILLKLIYRAPVVYDIQDFWPDTLVATGMFNNQVALKMVDLYCKLFYKMANKIVVLSPGFKKKLIEKGVPENKIEVIYNWFNEQNLTVKKQSVQLPGILTQKDSFKVLFAGNMGKAQALDTVLQAAKKLKEKANIHFVFIGGGIEVENLKSNSRLMELSNVHFLAPVPFDEIGEILNCADVLLVHLKKDPLFEITIPSKIQAYLASGKPILSAVPGDASDLIVRAQAGMICPSENPDQLAETVIEFSKLSPLELEKMGENGKAFYREELCMKVGIDQFDQVFKDLNNSKK